MTHFWLRAECRSDEFRTPITPLGAKKLIDSGISVTVEASNTRAFSTEEYRSIGCLIAEQGSWQKSKRETIILGLKELSFNIPLEHRHIMFAHAFKKQKNSREILTNFKKGGGILYDLEYLTDFEGKRVTAFGRFAGFSGAIVGLNLWLAKKRDGSDRSFKMFPNYNKAQIIKSLRSNLSDYTLNKRFDLRVIIIGANGRVGRGAKELYNLMGIKTTNWDMAETVKGGPFSEILDYDIFVNCVLSSSVIRPFIDRSLLDSPRRLLVISDVSCDPGSDYNTIPLYDQPNSFRVPFHEIMNKNGPLYITAIDNLPSMLPKESSLDFESQLLPYLQGFKNDQYGVWARAKQVFSKHSEDN